MNSIYYSSNIQRLVYSVSCLSVLFCGLIMATSRSEEILLIQQISGHQSTDGRFSVSLELTAGAYSPNPNKSDTTKVQPPGLYLVVKQSSTQKRWDFPVGEFSRLGRIVKIKLEDVLEMKADGKIAKLSHSEGLDFEVKMDEVESLNAAIVKNGPRVKRMVDAWKDLIEVWESKSNEDPQE